MALWFISRKGNFYRRFSLWTTQTSIHTGLTVSAGSVCCRRSARSPASYTEIASMDLTTPLTYVKGIGPARAAMLEAKGLTTVEDLLGYVPFRYEDRSNMKPVSQLAPGEMATVIAEVRSVKMSGFKRCSLGMFEARFT